MNDYRGLRRTLHFVRGAQNYAAVAAEVLILLAFALSGLDVSIGGKLVGISWLPWVWGAIFALGIDTSFVLAWVRVRQSFTSNRTALWWSIPLALGMSIIVFQPVAIQQLQQSMGISFNQSLSNLGVDMDFLVYARSFVAVLLGAILAMTNIEAHVTPAVAGVASNVVTLALDLLPEPHEPSRTVYDPFPFEQAVFHTTSEPSMNRTEPTSNQSEPLVNHEPNVNRTTNQTNQTNRTVNRTVNQYELVKAHYEPNRTYAEIAKLSGVPLGSVKRHAVRIKKERNNAGI